MLRTVLDPFSEEAKRIVKGAPPLDQLPEEVFRAARRKVDWLAGEKRPPKSLFSLDAETDVLSWYVLFFAVGTNFTRYSGEARLVEEACYSITRDRLDSFEREEGERVLWRMAGRLDMEEGQMEEGCLRIGDVLIEKKDLYAESSLLGTGRRTGLAGSKTGRFSMDRRTKRFGIPWKTLIPLVSAKRTKLTDWYIRGCLAVVSLEDLMEVYSGLVTVDALKHMERLRQEASHIRTKETDELARHISAVAGRRTALAPAISFGKAESLKPGNFPPCVKVVLQGVTSGSRNFAITVFLTSFLSYARIAPAKAEDPRISDYVKDQKVIDEIMPLIDQAAERCSPPFFEDQPLERLNVVYHLGMGMNEEPLLENSGASKWYFPPNCEKVQREAPPLCKPDELCKRVKNPLNYYFLKGKEEDKEKDAKGS
jgi:DNA primase large subunit